MIVPEEYVKPFIGRFEDKVEQSRPYEILHSGYNRPRYRHAAFAGAMTFLDRDIGKILTLLDELELDDDTLMIFSSDNGPHSEGGADPEYFDSNGILRRGKGWLYEGGIRVPMIARWPGRIAAGSRTGHPCYFPDLLPTIAEICGVEAKSQDGISFAPTLLRSGRQSPHDYMNWSYNRHRAVRAGRWKLYRFYDNFNDTTKYKDELFDLIEDPGESNDLSARHPEQAKAMAERIWQHERWKK